MDDEKISLRISKEELQAIDLYLSEHPEEGSRSHFIKNAIRASLNRDAQATSGKGNMSEGNRRTVVVEFPEYMMAVMDALTETMYGSHAELIRDLVRQKMDADGLKAREVIDKAFSVATLGIRP